MRLNKSLYCVMDSKNELLCGHEQIWTRNYDPLLKKRPDGFNAPEIPSSFEDSV